MESSALKDFNNQPVSVLQNNLTTIHGIFSLLRQLNGNYSSRYIIDAEPRESYPISSLDQYFEWTANEKYWSIDGSKTINITFDSPFLLSGYALSNGFQNSKTGNTFPSEWKIYGVTENENILLDEQSNQQFCGENVARCFNESVKGYSIKLQYRAFKKFIFEQTKNSGGFEYLFLRSFDLFGTLCGINDQCNYHFFQLTAKTNLHKCNLLILHSFLFSLS